MFPKFTRQSKHAYCVGGTHLVHVSEVANRNRHRKPGRKCQDLDQRNVNHVKRGAYSRVVGTNNLKKARTSYML